MQSLAVSGCTVNLVLFLVRVLQQDNVVAANAVTNWIGTTFFTSFIGASIGDAYLGRLWTCVLFQIFFAAGALLFALSGSIISQQPPAPCMGSPSCAQTTTASVQVSLFYVGLYMMGLATASFAPNAVSLGADQFDSPERKSTFLNLYMASANVGMLLSTTLISYFENEGLWTLGFSLSAGSGILALVFLLAGMPSARQYYNQGPNPLFRIAHVIVASARNWRADAPSSNNSISEASGDTTKLRTKHSKRLRCLDKAAIATKRTHADCSEIDPWSLCTVSQVEEVKRVCRLLPFCLCGILLSAVLAQKGTLFVLQGASMDNSVANFRFPPSSMGVFSLITVVLGAPLYSWVLVPCIVRFRKRRKQVTSIERMGAGLVVAMAAMAVAAVVESQRLKIAHKTNNGASSEEKARMSIFWLVPQCVLEGWTIVLFACGHMEFNYSESPEGMRSLATAISLLGMSLGNYLSSFIIQVVTAITSTGGRAGWIPKDLDEGHLDYVYWLLAGIVLSTLGMFTIFARWLGFSGDDGGHHHNDSGSGSGDGYGYEILLSNEEEDEAECCIQLQA